MKLVSLIACLFFVKFGYSQDNLKVKVIDEIIAAIDSNQKVVIKNTTSKIVGDIVSDSLGLSRDADSIGYSNDVYFFDTLSHELVKVVSKIVVNIDNTFIYYYHKKVLVKAIHISDGGTLPKSETTFYFDNGELISRIPKEGNNMTAESILENSRSNLYFFSKLK
jgi:hypothetical protein